MYRTSNSYKTYTPIAILPILQGLEPFSRSSIKLENALLFISNLYLRSFYYVKQFRNSSKIESINEMNGFMPINSDVIIAILGRDYYKDILLQLAELGIIEINNSYCTGALSKRYKLSDEYFIQKPIARELQNKKVRNKLDNLRELFKKRNQVYQYLHHQLENLRYIHIDKESANRWIEENISADKGYKRLWYQLQVDKIAYGFTKHLKVSSTNKRLHSPFVILPKSLRQFLYLVDEETGEKRYDKIEIDGSNTQPILLCVKMEQEGHVLDEKFKEYCLNGKIYDVIADEMEVERQWVKDRFMDTLLYTKRNGEQVLDYQNPNQKNADRQRFIKYFKVTFPKFYGWLKEMKKVQRKPEKAHRKPEKAQRKAEIAHRKPEKAHRKPLLIIFYR